MAMYSTLACTCACRNSKWPFIDRVVHCLATKHLVWISLHKHADPATCGGLTDGDGCGERGGGRYNFNYPYSRSINNNYKHTPGEKDCEHVQITSRKYKVSLLHKLLRNTMPNSSFPVHNYLAFLWQNFLDKQTLVHKTMIFSIQNFQFQ